MYNLYWNFLFVIHFINHLKIRVIWNSKSKRKFQFVQHQLKFFKSSITLIWLGLLFTCYAIYFGKSGTKCTIWVWSHFRINKFSCHELVTDMYVSRSNLQSDISIMGYYYLISASLIWFDNSLTFSTILSFKDWNQTNFKKLYNNLA